MSTNFPGALDDNTSLPNPTSGSYTNNPSHAALHGNAGDAIKALETKVGTGASTPPGSGYILTSSSNGTSSWQAPAPAGVWGAITGTLSNQTDLQAALNAKVNLSGGTMTGLLILSADPSNVLGAATKQYVDTKLALSGGTLTGNLILNADPSANLGAATKQYVDALGSTTLVRNETPGGTINGSNTAFTTAAVFATGSLKVYLNGQRLAPGSGIDYVEVTQGFTMQYAPASGDVLLVDYETTNTTRFVQGSNSIIVNETPTGTVNGVTTVFTTLQGKYVANTLQVFLNGLQMTKTTDFTETSPGAGTFTMVVAPTTGDVIRVSYQFATGASGNADTVDGAHASTAPTTGTVPITDANNVAQVSTYKNLYINGACQVAQRVTAPSLSTSAQYGSVDRFMANALSAVTAGTIAQGTGLSFGAVGTSLQLNGVSSTGSNSFFVHQRIESKNAIQLKNINFSVSALVNHNVGASVTYYIAVYSVTSIDNFSGTSLQSVTGGVAVASGTPTLIKFENITGFDTTNGLLITIQANTSAGITTKNFDFTNFQVNAGATAEGFVANSFDSELLACQRYYEKSYNYATAPGTSGILTAGASMSAATQSALMTGTANSAGGRAWGTAYFKVRKRVAPTMSYWDLNGNASATTALDNNGGTAAHNNTADAFRSVTGFEHYTLFTNGAGGSNYYSAIMWVASAEL